MFLEKDIQLGDELLTRDKFRELAFERDKHQCVICKMPALNVHHIIERRLWPDGGYYLYNAASLCGPCHEKAEETVLSCRTIREAAGISEILLPPHLYQDQEYDKWGNPILPNGMRMIGELFYDESIQKVLARGNVLQQFTKLVKYPRTYHLPWSPGLLNDDRQMPNIESFKGEEVVVMVKMDGENTTMYRDYLHNRSLEYEPHISRNRVRALHGQIAYEIPDGWRVCVENLYAKHAIHYRNLPDYAVLFAIWDDKNQLLPWKETKEWAELLDLTLCPYIYEGPWEEETIKHCLDPYETNEKRNGNSIYKLEGDEIEGYVVRVTKAIHYHDFSTHVGKYVRKGHVPVHGGFWKNQPVVPNELARRDQWLWLRRSSRS